MHTGPWGGEAGPGDTRSPLDAVVDMVTRHSDARLYIYESWADMGLYAPDPPISISALAACHPCTQSACQDWFGVLVGMVNAARPQAQLSLFPVAPLLSDLMTGVPAEGFSVDTARHGTDSTCVLSAMITCQVDFAAPPVAGVNSGATAFLNETDPRWRGGPEDRCAIRFGRTVGSPQGGIDAPRLTWDLPAWVHVDRTPMMDTEGRVAEETQVTPSAGQHALEVACLDLTWGASLQVGWHLVAPCPPMPPPRFPKSIAQGPDPQTATGPTTAEALMPPLPALPVIRSLPVIPRPRPVTGSGPGDRAAAARTGPRRSVPTP